MNNSHESDEINPQRPESSPAACPLCNGIGWRREWLIPILLGIASVLLFILGGWCLIYCTTKGVRRGHIAGYGIFGLYISILVLAAAWKARWRLCRCTGGRRGWLYDG